MNLIVEFFKNVYGWQLSIFSFILNWFLDLIFEYIEPMLEPLADALPDLSGVWSRFQMIAPFTAFVNQWIALDFAFTLLTAYFVFIVIMIPVKLIIKLFIPTVG